MPGAGALLGLKKLRFSDWDRRKRRRPAEGTGVRNDAMTNRIKQDNELNLAYGTDSFVRKGHHARGLRSRLGRFHSAAIYMDNIWWFRNF